MLPAALERTIHDAVTWYMVGVIWLVQLVQYPAFEFLNRATFKQSHALHTSTMGFVVGPAMLVELVLAAVILWRKPGAAAICGFLLVLALWGLTFFVMVPLHERLAQEGFSPAVHRALVLWNWPRTLAWTARGLIAAFWLSRSF